MNKFFKTLISCNLLTIYILIIKGFSAAKNLMMNTYFQWAVVYSTPKIAKVPLSQLINTNFPFKIQMSDNQRGTVRNDELIAIASIVNSMKPKHILEIGTCDGATTLNMAINNKEAVIFTIDLPLDQTETSLPGSDLDLINSRQVGKAFFSKPEAGRITQILCDSAKYNYATIGVSFGLIFIDGSHTYEYVKNDTEKTMPFLAPSGVMLWHDCCAMGKNYGVYKYLSQHLKDKVNIIEGTTLAYYINSNN